MGPAKVSVSARISKDVAEAIDQLAARMKPAPTRSQIVALALSEWIGSRSAQKRFGTKGKRSSAA